MDVLDFAVYVWFIPSVVIFAMGLTYRIFKFIFYRRVYEAKPPFRWREYVERYGAVVGYGFWHWLKELILVFIRPIWWTIRKEFQDFVFGLAFVHIIGIIPILLILGQHISIWVYYFRDIVPFAEPIVNLWYLLSTPLSMVSGFTHMPGIWGIATTLLNGDLLALLAIAGTCYKLGDHIVRLCRHIIHMRAGDFIALILVLCILVTGYLAARHLGYPNMEIYRLVLGLHVLFAELLLMFLPFTKFFHLIFGFWYGKIHEFYDMAIKRGV